MKTSTIKKMLALVLVACMTISIAVPASAAGGRGKGNGKGNNKNTSSSTGSESTMTLVEDDTTVEEETELRASTYMLSDEGVAATADTGTNTTIKYFPVTMYNYDETTINSATHRAEFASGGLLTQWNGIYFNGGNPGAESYESDEISIADGIYIIQNARAAGSENASSWLQVSVNDNGDTSITSTTSQNDATQWTIKKNSDGTYTLNSTSGYMTIGKDTSGTKTVEDPANIDIVKYEGNISFANSVQLEQDGYYLNWWTGSGSQFGGYTTKNDQNQAFYFYKVTDSGLKQVIFTSDGSLSYAPWDFWTGNIVDANGSKLYNGNYLYSGLVANTLDANKNIVFTKPEGGIFNSDATVKDIYTNVELPFIYKDTDVDGDGNTDGKYYTFDASQNAVYFHEDSTQNSTAAQSNGRLYLNQGNTQSISDLSAEDGSTTVFMPFNDTTTISSTNNADYHFGMAATIPFTMTTNGRLNPNNDSSDPITFSFSGDDDVWVFIDGQLVIDLGGIHNRLDATIDFAANTVTYTETNAAKGEMGDAADDLDVTAAQTLFGGLISQDRTTFAATDSHELTIYYLERGAGSSNCKIQFNLPMKDVVSVTKRATQSISSDGTLSPLTAKEQETVNNIDFGFTLTKNGTPVANTNYSLLNANGQVISTPSTDANGHFTLRNGQTAKFIGEIAEDGAEYQVKEDAVEGIGFKLPTYTYNGTAANGYIISSASYSKGADIPATEKNLTSAAVIAKGSIEAEDSLQFICENYFDANLPNPSSRPVDDQIVIDYGLSVIIDALANDVYRGDTIELTDVTGAQYGTAKIENGKITYQLTEQLTGVEVLTYTAKVTGSGNSGNDTTTADESTTAKIYIIPATSMYYEENFSGLVTYTDGTSATWSSKGDSQTEPQEPGVVGTVGDSPYGSDVAYLNDSGDSNGTSMYLDTTGSYARFSYSFTGTGTSFFARTGATAAYMQVIVKASDGTEVDNLRRNNIYKSVEGTDVGTLYNIPVYTIDGLNYGTYTVTVTVMKASESLNRGKDFYLDGIRVINPLFDPADDTHTLTALEQIAQTAYAADGEANMTVATLREKLIGEAQINEDDTISWNEGDNFVLFTDTNGEITSAEEYKSNGPKEEVYLNNGQSVTFSLYDWDPNTNKIYLGIKVPVGSGTVSINGNTLTINNAADCYYDISSFATITTDDDGINTATFEVKATSSLISVTNIKVTGNAIFTIVGQEDTTV